MFTLRIARFILHRGYPGNVPYDQRDKYVQVGYLKIGFNTRQKAAEYYDYHNPNMRRLNMFKTWESDWDPDTLIQCWVEKHMPGTVGRCGQFKDKELIKMHSRIGYTRLKGRELKAELRSRGLKLNGKVDALRKRLLADDAHRVECQTTQ